MVYWVMYFPFVFALAFIARKTRQGKSFTYPKLMVFLSVFYSMIFSQVIFKIWWWKLRQHMTAPEDLKFIADHDGGVIAVFMGTCFRGFISWLIGLLFLRIFRRKANWEKE